MKRLRGHHDPKRKAHGPKDEKPDHKKHDARGNDGAKAEAGEGPPEHEVHANFAQLADRHRWHDIGVLQTGGAEELGTLHEINDMQCTHDQSHTQHYSKRADLKQRDGLRQGAGRALIRFHHGRCRRAKAIGEHSIDNGETARPKDGGEHRRTRHRYRFSFEKRRQIMQGCVPGKHHIGKRPAHRHPGDSRPHAYAGKLPLRVGQMPHGNGIADGGARHEQERERDRERNPGDEARLIIRDDFQRSTENHQDPKKFLSCKPPVGKLRYKGCAHRAYRSGETDDRARLGFGKSQASGCRAGGKKSARNGQPESIDSELQKHHRTQTGIIRCHQGGAQEQEGGGPRSKGLT